jgi:hypothetical protein
MPNPIRGIIILNAASPNAQKMHGLTAMVRHLKSLSAWGINRVRDTHGVSVWKEGFQKCVIQTVKHLAAARKFIVNHPAQWAWD